MEYFSIYGESLSTFYESRENIMKPSVIALFALVVGLTSGCASVATVGSKPGDVPPRIVEDSKTGEKTWDNPGAFGPVPAELAARAQAICASLDKKDKHYKAIGYHPKAKNFEGKSFDGGGYYCVEK